jgi:hypothetical protein
MYSTITGRENREYYNVADKKARVNTVLLPWNDREIHVKTGATERLLLMVSTFFDVFCWWGNRIHRRPGGEK